MSNENKIKQEVDSLCFYFDWKRDGEQAFQIERSMVRLVTFTEQKANEEKVLQIQGLIEETKKKHKWSNEAEQQKAYYFLALQDLSQRIAESNE